MCRDNVCPTPPSLIPTQFHDEIDYIAGGHLGDFAVIAALRSWLSASDRKLGTQSLTDVEIVKRRTSDGYW